MRFLEKRRIHMTITQPNKMIDRKQLAARWNVSIPTLKRMEKRGLLDIVSLSERVLRYRLEDIERMEADQKGDVA